MGDYMRAAFAGAFDKDNHDASEMSDGGACDMSQELRHDPDSDPISESDRAESFSRSYDETMRRYAPSYEHYRNRDDSWDSSRICSGAHEAMSCAGAPEGDEEPDDVTTGEVVLGIVAAVIFSVGVLATVRFGAKVTKKILTAFA